MQNIKKDIQCVFERDPAARNLFEVLTNCPGLWAIIFHRINHQLWRIQLKWLARFGSTVARFLTGVEIHPGAVIGQSFFIDHGMGVVIGETTEIGNNCSIYHGVTLGGTTWNKGKRHPTLKNGVIIGAGAKILGPIILGNQVRVGSNSVVVKDVPDDATVVGIPGRIITKDNAVEAHMQDIAKKIGFNAYGMTKDMPDPIVNAIDFMLEHIHSMDEQINALCDAIKTMGIQDAVEKLDKLELNSLGHAKKTSKKTAVKKSSKKTAENGKSKKSTAKTVVKKNAPKKAVNKKFTKK